MPHPSSGRAAADAARPGAALPGADALMHPCLHPAPFRGAGWLFEHKLDGFRALARRRGPRIELLSRHARAFTHAFPEVVAALQALPCDAVVDGELVVCDVRGHPRWDRLRRRAMMKRPAAIAAAAAKEPATFAAFDLLWIDGRDVRDRPLTWRKQRLAQVLPGGAGVHRVAHLEGDGEALFAKAVELGLEGVVAKRADSAYVAGRQSTWLKIKNRRFYRREAIEGFRA